MSQASARSCLLYNISRLPYAEALALQHELHQQCVAGEISNCLVLLEHDPVVTLGVKQSSRSNLVVSEEVIRAKGVSLVETDRGGDVTYHCPGQLVGYPILRIREIGNGDLHGYLRSLEESVIRTLREFGLEGHRKRDAGVWVGDKKICSIGVAVRKWVSYHGFALNVDPLMECFSLINPCGLSSAQMTSMAELLDDVPQMENVKEFFARNFAEVFELTLSSEL